MKYNREEISKNIRNKRREYKLSQEELGKKLGLAGKQISNYETGKLVPPVDILLKLCDVFDCELGYLLGEPEYIDGTKAETDFLNRVGLTKETVENIKVITGTESTCLDFGYSAGEYRRIFNRMLSSNLLIPLMESMHDLEYYYEVTEGYEIRKAKEKYGEDRVDNAIKNYTEDTDYTELDSDSLKDCQLIDELINREYEASFSVKVCRYDVWNNFEAIIDDMFPREKRETKSEREE